jgi:hypothetical protein
VLVDLSSRELNWSVEPLIDVIVVPREVNELVPLKFIDRLQN